MRIIGDTKIPFLSYRKIALTLSTLAIAGGLAYQFLGPGLNLGIDFVGGTQVTLKFREQPDLGELREAISGLTVGTPMISAVRRGRKERDPDPGREPRRHGGRFHASDPGAFGSRPQRRSRRPLRSQSPGLAGAARPPRIRGPGRHGRRRRGARSLLRPDGRRRARLPQDQRHLRLAR
ncbi:MAG: hypothetical protein EP299_01930 [Acidobacteria bacterium]|nr:MAG: hypothetical protein EP299_01930 [Acidobacteriota bacterium]